MDLFYSVQDKSSLLSLFSKYLFSKYCVISLLMCSMKCIWGMMLLSGYSLKNSMMFINKGS